MFYELCLMFLFHVICSMFYVLCAMFYVLCVTFHVLFVRHPGPAKPTLRISRAIFPENLFFDTVQNEASCQQNVGLDWVVKATPTLSLHSKSLSDLLITKVGVPCCKQAISSTITGRNPDRGAGEAISRAYPRVIDSWK